MGERSINTILRLKNESEYRAALKSCNQELKNLKSQLDLTSSEFRNNANSMEALTKKGDILSEMYESQKKKIATLNGALEKAKETRDQEQKTVSELRTRYEEAKKALDAYGDEVDESNEGYKAAKAEVDKLTNSLYTHQLKLDAADSSINKYSAQLNRATVELHDLEDRQEENNRLLEEAKVSADGCATSIDKYGDAVKEAADGTSESVSAVEALSAALVASGLQQSVEDLAGAMMECAEAAQTFELSIAKVYTLADESVLSQEAMRSGILEMSSELGKSADEIAEAVYEALSAGVDTANVLDFVRQSTQLSVAGFTDAANAVDVLTTILNAYGMEASQTEAIASKLVKTQDLGKITVDELSAVLGRVIPTAAAYSVNLDNIATAYANMTASGINAENTTTYLSTMLDELADSGSTVAGVLQQKTGKSFSELMASGKSLGDVLAILGDSVEGDTVQFSNLWSSATAGRAAIALFNTGVDNFNDTLRAMSTSSGTVAKNYNTMADTSDYASRRMKTAADNLKIAVGDQLNPVLDKLRNSAANILEVAADIVSDNPVLVSAIAGVVTALGLLAAGLSALMIVKSVTAAMQALNITLAANPIGLVAVAVAGLVAALATFNAQADASAEKIAELTTASQALTETIAAGNTSYEDAVASATAAYETVDRYIERLEALEAQGSLTDEQQAEYAMLLEQINAIMPELNASLDEQTGFIKGGADALRDQAKQWKNAAIQEAAYTRYKDDVDALAAAEYELTKNRQLLTAAEAKAKIIEDDLAHAHENLVYWDEQREKATMRSCETTEEYTARIAELDGQVNKYFNLERDLLDAQYDNNEQIKVYTKSIDTCNQTIAEQEPLVAAATDAWNSFGEQIEDTSGKAVSGTAGMSEDISKDLDKITKEYKSLRDAAVDSINTQIGLFDKISLECEMTTQDMINNLLEQKRAFDDYADNISLAVERGIDFGLVQQLSDGSEESMAILAQLVTATDEQIAELNAAFRDNGEARENMANMMTSVSEAGLAVLDKYGKDMYAKAVGMGENMVDGLIAGIKKKAPTYTAAVGDLANAGINHYGEVNKIQSPSKRYEEMAEWDVAGLTTTYKKSIPKVEASTAELANSGYAAAIRSRQRSMSALSSVAQITARDGSAELLPMLRQILTAIREGKVLSLNSGVVAGELLNPLDAQLGQDRILAERGAK